MDSTARVRTLSVKRQRSPTYQRAKPVTPATRNTRRACHNSARAAAQVRARPTVAENPQRRRQRHTS